MNEDTLHLRCQLEHDKFQRGKDNKTLITRNIQEYHDPSLRNAHRSSQIPFYYRQRIL